jgi:magnesium transporter
MNRKKPAKIKEYRGRATTWTHVGHADMANIRALNRVFPIHEHDMRELLPALQHSKCIVRPTYSFLVLILPLRDQITGGMHETELDVILTKDTLITELILSQNPAEVLLSLLDRIYRSSFPFLVQLSHDVRDVENLLFNEERREETIRKVLLLKNTNARVRKAFQGHKYALTELRASLSTLNLPVPVHFSHLISATINIWNSLEAQRESIDTLHETNETLLTYRTNKIMKTLTIFTSILLPLSLATNIVIINSPATRAWNESHYGFGVTMIFLGLVTLAMLAFFKKKGWI